MGEVDAAGGEVGGGAASLEWGEGAGERLG